jgi:hypothetical protein
MSLIVLVLLIALVFGGLGFAALIFWFVAVSCSSPGSSDLASPGVRKPVEMPAGTAGTFAQRHSDLLHAEPPRIPGRIKLTQRDCPISTDHNEPH